MNATFEAAITKQAIADAKLFCEEFPGQSISGDWDSEAFSIAMECWDLDEEDQDLAWDLYRTELHYAVDNAKAK